MLLLLGGLGLIFLSLLLRPDSRFPAVGPLGPPVISGESAEEYRWRSEGQQLRETARALLEDEIQANAQGGSPGGDGQTLQKIAGLLDQASMADEHAAEVRAREAVGNRGEGGDSGSDGTSTAAIVAAFAGLAGAVAGVITAIATLIKNRSDAKHAAMATSS